MKTESRSRVRRAAHRITAIWSELENAERRLFETPSLDRRGKRSQAELDALYAVPPSKRPPTR